MEIRPPATPPADHPAIARLHAASWATTYRGMLPDAYLDGPMAEDLARQWACPPAPEGSFRLVACQNTRLTGFAAALPRGGDVAYLDNLHVDPALKGQGTGTCLLRAMATEALRRGFTTLDLTVLLENHAARRFYTRLGGKEGPAYDDKIFGQKTRSCHITWTDLTRLAAPP